MPDGHGNAKNFFDSEVCIALFWGYYFLELKVYNTILIMRYTFTSFI